MLDFSNPWKIIEANFDPNALGKVEANFCLGNGYLGLRSATEEQYRGETRDLLVAGTFNRFSEEEVTELPNAADVTNIEITLNGARFDLTQGTIRSYYRELNIQNGLLTREVEWTSPKGENFKLKFERMVSLERLHSIAARITITAESDAAITIQSGITFVLDATHHFYVDGAAMEPKSDINILRRRMFSKFALEVKAGQTMVLEKFSNIFTSRDKELAGFTKNEIQAHALKQLQEDEKAGFNCLLAESAVCWLNKVWNRVPIEIDGPGFDQLAIRFAQYHMQLMTPAHDNRMNIGAKGLSGEGYKGHTFWDTEIFLLP